MTTTLNPPPATDTAAADLVLARMSLPSKSPVGPGALRKDIGKLLDSDMSTAELNELRTALASEGFLTKGDRNMFALTDAGRERALRFLGVAELSPEVTWSTVIARCLFPKAAGLPADEAAKLDSGDKLTAIVLKRKYGLPAEAGATVNQVLEAVACKQLGFAQETTLEGLMCAVLSKLMGSERLIKKDLAKQFPLFETGMTDTSADAARCAFVRDGFRTGVTTERQSAPPAPPRIEPEHEPIDLPTFAATVRALAADSPPQDRFHDNKVFIAALWRASQREPSVPRMPLEEFKRRLVDASSQNLLRLSRADFVQGMDPELLADSETADQGATLHFVVLQGETIDEPGRFDDSTGTTA